MEKRERVWGWLLLLFFYFVDIKHDNQEMSLSSQLKVTTICTGNSKKLHHHHCITCIGPLRIWVLSGDPNQFPPPWPFPPSHPPHPTTPLYTGREISIIQHIQTMTYLQQSVGNEIHYSRPSHVVAVALSCFPFPFLLFPVSQHSNQRLLLVATLY